jgi:hypothetical protein
LRFGCTSTEKSHFVRISHALATELARIRPAETKTGESNRMKKTLCAGVVALAMGGLLLTVPGAGAAEIAGSQGAHAMPASINVGRIHRVLNLTPAQERYWRPVEAALRQLARRQERSESEGFVHRISRRVVSIVLTSAAIERLAAAARPLIKVLDERQKQAAGQLAQEMGLGPVVMAALN